MSDDLAVCPDGRTRLKIWHLFAAADPRVRPEDHEYRSVCGVRVFADYARRLPGASNPHCFSEDWGRITCVDCLRSMEKGLPA